MSELVVEHKHLRARVPLPLAWVVAVAAAVWSAGEFLSALTALIEAVG